ncbi:MAG: glycerate kinase [Erysipelotrichaceae bacterium]|nr:glycerate kinase [Erysipelotrichaceae bacterium]
MKIVVAPDSFKESMSASEAAKAMHSGIVQYDSSIETILKPLADGGEGTLQTLVDAMQGKVEYYDVHGPLLKMIKAPIGYVDDIAIIECAKVCGLELLKEEEKDPYKTSTYGLGELIQIAIKNHAKTLMICLGGSATNDGGIGMLEALGVQILDKDHHQVTPTMQGLLNIDTINNIDIPMLSKINIIGVCDVTNPLCGKQGASYIYGPQKGLKTADLALIDEAMHNYGQLADKLLNRDYRHFPGSGAAGGLGYALVAFMHAKLRAGFDVVSEVSHLEEAIQEADMVIVGEGKIDRQTQYGKTPYGVLKIAQKYHKPVFAYAGKVEDHDVLNALGFENVYAISPSDMALSVALKLGKENMQKCIFTHMQEMINEIYS